jgi:hypothetical protein
MLVSFIFLSLIQKLRSVCLHISRIWVMIMLLLSRIIDAVFFRLWMICYRSCREMISFFLLGWQLLLLQVRIIKLLVIFDHLINFLSFAIIRSFFFCLSLILTLHLAVFFNIWLILISLTESISKTLEITKILFIVRSSLKIFANFYLYFLSLFYFLLL